MIQGKTYTSNNAKLLKHLNTLKGLQDGKISPIILHLALTNICNLNCSFCCFANRKKGDELSLGQVKLALDSFKNLGTRSLEFTGGGEPTLYPQINEAIDYAYGLGYKFGLCTNGKTLRRVKDWGKFEWVRLGLYFNEQEYKMDLDYLRSFDLDVGGTYIYSNVDDEDKNIENINMIIDFAESNEIPTRLTVDAVQEKSLIKRDFQFLKDHLRKGLKYCFLSDFNVQTERKNNHCYMHMIKPFVFPDGFVYACPCTGLTAENNSNVGKLAKICSIEEAEEYYKKMKVGYRVHKCSFCKYAQQNELIEDILTETEHNEFV
jgi:sulfatase maturation enzyme AslB (radical SAM superfamily)